MAKRSSKRRKFPPAEVSSSGETIHLSSLVGVLWRQGGWQVAVLVLAVLIAYQPVWFAGYIWDDSIHLTENPCIVGPRGFTEIWTTQSISFYPLVLSTFWIEHALWGLGPLPYHLVNVALHAICAVLLWRVLLALCIPGAWLGAALWALHPVQVESVAWISEQKNTESGVFFLLSVLWFLRHLKTEKVNEVRWNYALALGFAALAMLGKSSTVILPVVLGLCVWWIEGKWRWANLVKLAPFFVVAALISLLAISTFHALTNVDPLSMRSLPQRLVDAGAAVWFYLEKLAWPYPIMMIYPPLGMDFTAWTSWLPLVSVLVLLAVFWWMRGTWGRPWFFAFVYFLVALFPALGVVNQSFVRYSLVGDHLQYLADMGPLALIGAGLFRLTDRPEFIEPVLRGSFAAALLVVLGGLSWCQVWNYQDQQALWTDNVAKNPSSIIANVNLGNALLSNGNAAGAEMQYERVLALNPRDAKMRCNLASTLFMQGRLDEAIAMYEKSLEIDPKMAVAEVNLAELLEQKGDVAGAEKHYRRAVEISPSYMNVHYRFGTFLLRKGEVDAAIEQYLSALKINPRNAEIHNNLGVVYTRKKQLPEAMAQFQQAVELMPDYADAQKNLMQVRQMMASEGK